MALTPAKLVLPDGLRLVRGDWFSQSSIVELFVSKSVEEIQDGAFAQCRNLVKVTFAEDSKLQKIGKNCFQETGIAKISIPDCVVSIEDNAF